MTWLLFEGKTWPDFGYVFLAIESPFRQPQSNNVLTAAGHSFKTSPA